MLVRFALLIAVFYLLRALYYFYYYKRVKRYSDIYAIYCTKQDEISSQKLFDVRDQIKHVFKLAGLHKVTIPYVQPVGLGMASRGSMSPVDNIDNLREDVVGANVRMFEAAIGACKHKAAQSFNPVFWLENVIYLPTNVMAYLGFKKDKSLIKFAQLIWWLITALALIIGLVFNQTFTTWLGTHST